MKTILVLTDLSYKAAHAADVAVKIAKKMEASIVLYNAFPIVELSPTSSVGSWPTNDYASQQSDSIYVLNTLAESLKSQFSTSGYQPQISIKNEAGNLIDNIEQLLQEIKPDMVVMGAKSVDRLGHFLIGSESNAVMHQATCPVLFIPETYVLTTINKIALAVDLENVKSQSIGLLTDFARGFDAEIILTHITKSEDEATLGFTSCLNEITKTYNYLKATNTCLVSKDLKAELLEIPTLLQADILVMVHHKLGFWNRIFTESMTKHVLKQQQVPLLVLPG